MDRVSRRAAATPVDADGADPSQWLVTVSTPDASWTVEVHRGRMVPTVQCGSPGGLPYKMTSEFVVGRVSANP